MMCELKTGKLLLFLKRIFNKPQSIERQYNALGQI